MTDEPIPSRRAFLAGTAAAGAGLVAGPPRPPRRPTR
jgi:hypothetical protein